MSVFLLLLALLMINYKCNKFSHQMSQFVKSGQVLVEFFRNKGKNLAAFSSVSNACSVNHVFITKIHFCLSICIHVYK